VNKIKLFVAGAIASVGTLVLPMVALGAGEIITLPANFVSDSLAYVGNLFTDLSSVIVLVIGLPLAFWVIRKTISLVRAR
jgi:hypothetical protein